MKMKFLFLEPSIDCCLLHNLPRTNLTKRLATTFRIKNQINKEYDYSGKIRIYPKKVVIETK